MKKLKIGDNVKVILGKDKGKVGTIKTIYHKKNTLIIEGINTKIKHVKPTRKEEAGKIYSKVEESGIEQFPGNQITIWTETFDTIQSEFK